MKNIIPFLAILMQFSSCSQLGTCDQKEAVSFRGVKFEFPIRAYDVIKNSKNPIYRKSRWIHTDSIAANTSAIWFFDWPDNDRERRGSLDYLKRGSRLRSYLFPT